MIFDRIIHKIKKVVLNSYHFRKNDNIKWIGNSYGGFYVDTSLIKPESVVFSIGIGEDISFDEGIAGLGVKKVYLFDPTPKSINYIKSVGNRSWIHFTNVGVSTIDEVVKFYLPKDTDHVSGSVYVHNNTDNSNAIEVQLHSVKTLLKMSNCESLDLLKMDIEGSEYQVLQQLMKDKIFPSQICVEFHNRYFKDGNVLFDKTINSLKNNGYEIFGVSKTGEEYLFVRTV